MIPMAELMSLDVLWFVLGAACLTVIAVVLGPLIVRQARHQAAEDAALDRWRRRDGAD